jgi:hypothetical protein
MLTERGCDRHSGQHEEQRQRFGCDRLHLRRGFG